MWVPGTVLVPAEPRDHAVGGALVLDLEHRPLARLIGRVEPLRDDTVQARAFEPLEPALRRRPVARRRCQVDGRLDLSEDGFEAGAPVALGCRPQVLVTESEEIPRHEARR